MHTISAQRPSSVFTGTRLTFKGGRPKNPGDFSVLMQQRPKNPGDFFNIFGLMPTSTSKPNKDSFHPQHTEAERQPSVAAAETPAPLPKTFVSTSTQTEEIPPEETPLAQAQKPNTFQTVFQVVADIPPETAPAQSAEKARARTASVRAEESSGEDEIQTPKKRAKTQQPPKRKTLVVRGSSEEDGDVTPSASTTRKQPIVPKVKTKPNASTTKKREVAVEKAISELSAMEEKAYADYVKAIEAGKLKEVKQALRKYPGFVDEPDDTNLRPLAVAASANQPEMVRFFLNKRGVEINAQDDADYTAVMWPDADKSGYIETLQVFMDYRKKNPDSLDLSKKDTKGMRASSHAFSNATNKSLSKRQKEELEVIIKEMRAHETKHEE